MNAEITLYYLGSVSQLPTLYFKYISIKLNAKLHFLH